MQTPWNLRFEDSNFSSSPSDSPVLCLLACLDATRPLRTDEYTDIFKEEIGKLVSQQLLQLCQHGSANNDTAP